MPKQIAGIFVLLVFSSLLLGCDQQRVAVLTPTQQALGNSTVVLPTPEYTNTIPTPISSEQALPPSLLTPPISSEPTQPPLAGLNFTSLQMLSADKGWALSGRVITEYKAGSWQRQEGRLSNELISTSSSFVDIAMVSSDEGWMVGHDTSSLSNGAALAHYSAGKWTPFPVDPSVYNLRAISMVSPSEGWIVGGVFEGGVHFCSLLHYNGATWQKQDCPLEYPVYAVHMLNATEGWAIGMSGGIMHYHDGAWQKVMGACSPAIEDVCNAPNITFTHSDLSSIYMISPNEGWAVGSGVILYYHDGQWQRAFDLAGTMLNSVYMTSANEGWAVGQRLGQTSKAAILHYSGGQWHEFAIPSVAALHRVYMVSSTEGWAVGEQGTVLHYQDGSWTEYPQLKVLTSSRIMQAPNRCCPQIPSRHPSACRQPPLQL